MPDEPSGDDQKTDDPDPVKPDNPVQAPTSEEDKMLQEVAKLEKESPPAAAIGTKPDKVNPVPLANNSFSPQTTKSKSKKKLAVILAAIILLVFAGSGTAYALWFIHPDTVTADAVKNLINSKTMINEGEYTFKDNEAKSSVALAFKSQSDVPKYAGSLDVDAKINYQKFSVNVKGAGLVSESGTVYFKLSNVVELINKALETDYGKLYVASPQLQDAIKKFSAKIDNKWIRLDKSDLAAYSGNYDKERTCYKKALGAFYSDQSQQQQVVDTYKNNRFIVVAATGKSETINGQDSVSYSVSEDVKKAGEFGEAVKKTSVGNALVKCDKSGNFDRKQTPKEKQQEQKRQQEEADKTKTTVWISRWSHQLTKIETNSNDKKTANQFSAAFKPNEELELNDPKSFIKAAELQKDINDIFNQASQASLGVTDPAPTQN